MADPRAEPSGFGDIPASDERVRRLKDLRAGNAALVQQLSSVALQPDTRKTRLELLIELILSDEDRLEFELAYEQRLRELMTRPDVAAEVRRRTVAAVSAQAASNGNGKPAAVPPPRLWRPT